MSRRSTAHLAALLTAFLAAIFTEGGASAAPPQRSRVTVVRVESSDPLIREANTRLRAELTGAGFEVLEVERPAGSARDRRDRPEAGSDGTHSFATVAIERAGPGASAEVWIDDLVTGKTVVRRLSVGAASNAAAVLAIRALELLRASLLEVAIPFAPATDTEVPPEPPRADPPGDVMSWVQPKLRPRSGATHPFAGPAVSIGVLALHSFQSIGPAFGPALRVSHGIGQHALARLSLSSAVVAPRVTSPGGEATVQQHFGSFDVGWVSASRPLIAFAWAGLGAYYLRTNGEADAPLRASSGSAVSALATAGIGGLLRLGSAFALSADIAALALVPQPVVVIAGSDAGTAGAPSIAATLALVVEL